MPSILLWITIGVTVYAAVGITVLLVRCGCLRTDDRSES